ncbi:hypothetical protein [Parapedobacter tibetensis]|uniref:hypothetical protein n=1 Tax=Parapedobacter tibetensis TaxID=2972951 RepID=UPI00214D8184|nr:hypothetical protein [Parapedobacter tibetensis]
MKRLILFFFIPLSLTGYAQYVPFTADSIPTVDGKVVFSVDFDFDLNKEEFHKRAHAFLNDELNPYSGTFRMDSDDHTVCRITEYIGISASFFQTFGMYMTYSLQLGYRDGSCAMVIHDITYMEKEYFEAQEKAQRKLNMPAYSGEDVMIDKKYTLMLIGGASDKVAEASVARINEIVNELEASFADK